MPRIRDILTANRPLHWLSASSTVTDAVKLMVEHNVGALPVLEGDRLVGVLSKRDLMRRVIVRGLDIGSVTVAAAMTSDIITADIDDDHLTCLKKMTSRNCRHLPVIAGSKLVGFLSSRDLMRVDAEGKELEIKSLTDYIHYVPPVRE